ncbi:peptidylprolyl isomerase [Marasmitruncus massiliensis]|uniref:peptidylprolyl isomerase n=1 Tax=Marasmitruncus massiliensis TaxID=1944642 RepID=UPI000C7D84CF|nr:peptidylprolyl isomerase [Marasmitruncus massiliensis]
MKKIALLLSALLALSVMFYGCGKKNEASPASSDASASESAQSMPSTESEIIGHNLKISEEDINLLQAQAPAAGSQTATIKTSAGDIKIVLYPEEAPKAVENWIALAKKGYYDNQKFYEVLPSVRICTGDPEGTGNKGESSFEGGEKFDDEYSVNLWHFNGAVAMNNGGSKDRNDSRFYIIQNSSISDDLAEEMLDVGFPEKVVDQYLKAGGVPNYDFKDTVFAQVVEGLDIVEKIASAPRDDTNKPKEDITILSIEIA